MPVSLIKDRPVKPDALNVLKEAAKALKEYDTAKATLRDAELKLQRLRRDYGLAAGVWGFQVHHLRNACKASGLL